MKPLLVLFDFDGTLTTKDTFLEYIKFVRGKMRFWLGFALLSPILVAMKLKMVPNWRAKEIVLKHFFGGMDIEKLKAQGQSFAQTRVPEILRKGGLEQIATYKEQGARIIVITASIELWVKPWADSMELEILGTLVEEEKGTFTGKIKGANCYGPEKVKRLQAYLSLSDHTTIHAYGDSRGDKEMFAIADKTFYRPFRS